MRDIHVLIRAPLLLPFAMLFLMAGSGNHIFADVRRWAVVYQDRVLVGTAAHLWAFCRFMTFHPEFRSVFYFRVRSARPLSFLLKPMPTLFIHTKDIGPGLFIQHGFATIITAKKIGSNCWINQQVTIGFNNKPDAPTLGDNVTISAGAIVIGDVVIGDNARVGAGSVVTKDVEPNTVVAGVPARPLRRAATS